VLERRGLEAAKIDQLLVAVRRLWKMQD
jgi:hypothetical protein